MGISLVALFFAFGTAMSGLTVFLLVFPGTALDHLWRINPHAQQEFTSIGNLAVMLMVAVCAACSIAAVGLWRQKGWGIVAAVILLCINLVGDVSNALLARSWHTLIGVPVAAIMMGYLLREPKRLSSMSMK